MDHTGGDLAWLPAVALRRLFGSRAGHAAAVALIFGLGVFLRVRVFGEYWVNGDEGNYWSVAATPDAAHAAREIQVNGHPPLWFHLLRSLAAFDTGFEFLRAPSLVFGLLLLPLAYALGRAAGGRNGGLIAALLAAASPGAVLQSQVMRPYTLQLFLIGAAIFALHRCLQDGRWPWPAAYGLLIAVASALHYGTFVTAGGIGIRLLVLAIALRPPARRIVPLALAHLPVAAVAAWVYVGHYRDMLYGSRIRSLARTGWLQDQFVGGVAELPGTYRAAFEYAFGVDSAIVAAVLVVIGVVAGLRLRRPLAGILPAATMLVATALSAAGLYPLGGTRHSLHLLPVLILPAASGFAVLAESRRKILRAAALLSFALLALWAGRGCLAEHSLRRGLPRELRVLRSDADPIRRLLDRPARPGEVWLTDVQTYYLLVPLIDGPRPVIDLGAASAFEAFTWGDRRIVVNRTWTMHATAEHAAKPGSLAGLLRALDREAGSRGRWMTGAAWVVGGGAMRTVTRTLRELARDSRDLGPPVVLEDVGGTDFSACRIDPVAYEALMARGG